MLPKLTRDVAYKQLTEFFDEKPFILFATGTSCALDLRFGMPALEKHLKERLATGLSEDHNRQWQAVLASLEQYPDNFEKAMDCITDDALTEKIVNLTGAFVAGIDQEHAPKILTGEEQWPGLCLIQWLFRKFAKAGSEELHVATPNYDLLGEYAFCQAGIPYITGFTGGFCRDLDWTKSKRSFQRFQQKNRRCVQVKEPHIVLHKPHGSLNTFEVNGRTVQCDGWITSVPDQIKRSMVTPGTEKYKVLHDNRSNLLAKYDTAVDRHNRFLFLGFGFNDAQLVNNRIIPKLKAGGCKGLIITRDTNPRIEEILKESPNLWLVCKQESNDSTRVKNGQYIDWLYLDDEKLWNFDEFTRTILGS
ncbi:SIR2 family protein [Sansalvadorimonas sp. 2012CJ34-2]|uniref:SIR2 family protein n=1 Tax=Parendozoicomonas callyspongiae TaxID=2942213 RepID=A0ABT0PKQ3_9GAMM|nr:SIR2 family protein [Sansalvadorimonas sp. 2012CJ34-2]MCL6271913.1 SIR2 family protein [Sansalvadorimonas sp. 2012CJ34-2]